MGSAPNQRRVGSASFVAVLVIGSLLGLTACGAGGGNPPTRATARSSTGLPADRSSANVPTVPGAAPSPSGRSTRIDGAPSTRTQAPTRTATPAATSTQPPVAALPPTSTPAPIRTATPAATPAATSAPPPAAALPPAPTPTASVSGTATAAQPGGLGTLGWALLIALVAALIGGLLIWRSRRTSAWDAQASALEAETRTATATRLPSVLTTQTAGQRGLSWPPLRAGLIDLAGRWDDLTEHAPNERRRNRSQQLRSLLQDLVAAVDAENEALATGRDWSLLRPRVNEAERALSAALAGQTPGPPAAEEPGPPTSRT